jgi:hypothetical protein
MMKIARRAMTAGSLVLALSACGDDPLAPADVAGQYSLSLVNGWDLPVVSWVRGSTSEQVTGGILLLEDTCTSATLGSGRGCYRIWVDLITDITGVIVETTLEDKGFWQLVDGEIEFDSEWAPADVKWSTMGVGNVVVLEMNRTHMPVEPDTLTFVR